MEDLLKAIEDADKEIEINKEYFPKKQNQIKVEKSGLGTFGSSKRRTFDIKKSEFDILYNAERPGKRVIGGVISHAKKEKEKCKDKIVTVLYPNYDFILKKTPSVSFRTKKNVEKPKSEAIKKEINDQNNERAGANSDGNNMIIEESVSNVQIENVSISSPIPKIKKEIDSIGNSKSIDRLSRNQSSGQNSIDLSMSTMASEFEQFMKLKAE